MLIVHIFILIFKLFKKFKKSDIFL